MDNDGYPIRLSNVQFVPNISDNLFSIGSADDAGVSVEFTQGAVCVRYTDRIIIATGSKAKAKLYKLNIKVPMQANICQASRSLEEWHRVLGHPDKHQVQVIVRNEAATGIKIVQQEQSDQCGQCQRTQSHTPIIEA